MKYINTNKLERLKITKENTYIVMDFDKTITTGESLDSWSIAARLLGEDINKEMDILYKKYRPIELNYEIAYKEKEKAMIEWYESCMSLYTKYNLTKEKLINSVQGEGLIFREGIKELLEKAYKENIPIIILSAGIGNVIKEFLAQQNCYFDNIYIISNFIEFDENGKAKKFDNSIMIHTLNKSMRGKLPEKQLDKIKGRKYKILVGDLKEDENMVDKEEWSTTLKIGMLNNNTKEILKVYKETFDIVLTEEDANFKEILGFFN